MSHGSDVAAEAVDAVVTLVRASRIAPASRSRIRR
jgi:hypothetical protein